MSEMEEEMKVWEGPPRVPQAEPDPAPRGTALPRLRGRWGRRGLTCGFLRGWVDRRQLPGPQVGAAALPPQPALHQVGACPHGLPAGGSRGTPRCRCCLRQQLRPQPPLTAPPSAAGAGLLGLREAGSAALRA